MTENKKNANNNNNNLRYFNENLFNKSLRYFIVKYIDDELRAIRYQHTRQIYIICESRIFFFFNFLVVAGYSWICWNENQVIEVWVIWLQIYEPYQIGFCIKLTYEANNRQPICCTEIFWLFSPFLQLCVSFLFSDIIVVYLRS